MCVCVWIFLLFPTVSIRILSGSWFLYIVIVGVVTSYQICVSSLFRAWYDFKFIFAFSELRTFTRGFSNFTDCDQKDSLLLSSLAAHFDRNIFCWFLTLIIFNSPSCPSKLSTCKLLFIFQMCVCVFFFFFFLEIYK